MNNLRIPFRISELIYRNIRNEISEEEKQELNEWIEMNTLNKDLYIKVISEENISSKLTSYNLFNKNSAWQKVVEKIEEPSVNRVFKPYKMLRYAAVILVPLLIGGYFALKIFDKHPDTIIVPGSHKAVLTLGNGKQIELNNTTKETIIKDEKVNILDAGKTLKYIAEKIKETTTEHLIYNTLSTPKGGEYTVELTDGTKIWLNADSRLRYPVKFSVNERKVFIEGEAYFEVSKDPDKPFIVNVNNMQIKVLGTSFNVMAYSDENNIATTLVEGKVQINTVHDSINNKNCIIIKPGEQALLMKNNNTIHVKEVNTEVYTAWKEGMFVIANETLESLMRRLGRWYNFETRFINPETRNYHFSGTLGRYENINEILEMISLTTNIFFEIRDNTIFVNSKKI